MPIQMSSQISLRAAHALGFGCGAWLAGSIASISLITIPALEASKIEDSVSSTTLVKQWEQVYNIGKATAPPFAAVCSAAYGYLAWSSRHLASQRLLWMYSGSAVLTLAIVPFTLTIMNANINELVQQSALSRNNSKTAGSPNDGRLDDKDIDRLIRKWGSLNLVRSLLPLAGCGLAFFAM